MLYTKSDTVTNSPRTESLDIHANRSNKPQGETEEPGSAKEPTDTDVNDDAQSRNSTLLASDSEKKENEDKNNREANQNPVSHNTSPETLAVIHQSFSCSVIPLEPNVDPTEMSLVTTDTVEVAVDIDISNEGTVSCSPQVQDICEKNQDSS